MFKQAGASERNALIASFGFGLVNFIFAWDSNADANPFSWNNGTNLFDTYVRAREVGLPFPTVPSAPTFVNRGYDRRPVFFGCDARLTTTGDERSPIVLYGPNAPYSAYTNFSFLQPQLAREQVREIFVNSFNEITQGNGTLGRKDWVECIGCAVIERSLSNLDQRTPRKLTSCNIK